MSPARLRFLHALIACLVLLGVGAAPSQASFIAEATDPAGDHAEPGNPSRDLLAGGIAYDRVSGTVVGSIKLAAAPIDDGALAALFVGSLSATGCNAYPAAGVSNATAAADARWHRIDGPGPSQMGYASVDRSGAVQTITARTKDELQGIRPQCAIITLSKLGDASVIYDAIGPIDLVPQPHLEAELRSVPKQFRAGRSRQVTVRISNPGDAPTGKVKLRFKTERGVKVSRKRLTVKSVKAGGHRDVKVRVTMSAKSDPGSDLEAIASVGKLEASDEARIWRTSPKRKGGGGGGSSGGKTCVRWIPDFTGESGGSLGLVPC